MHAASSCCLVAIGRLQVSSSPHWSPSGQFLTPIGCLLIGCLVAIGRQFLTPLVAFRAVPHPHWLSLGRLPCRHWSPVPHPIGRLQGSSSPPLVVSWSAASSPLVAFRSVPHPYWLSLGRLPRRYWSPSGQFLTPIGCFLVGCLVAIGHFRLVRNALGRLLLLLCRRLVVFISKSPIG
jgi:hypothetical protein